MVGDTNPELGSSNLPRAGWGKGEPFPHHGKPEFLQGWIAEDTWLKGHQTCNPPRMGDEISAQPLDVALSQRSRVQDLQGRGSMVG